MPGHDGPADFDGARDSSCPWSRKLQATFSTTLQTTSERDSRNSARAISPGCPTTQCSTSCGGSYNYVSWNEWPAEYAQRKHDAMTAVMNQHGRELAVEQAVQFFFNEQWCALKSYCADRKIRILGDVAIFVNYDSADVWTHPEIFELDEDRRPIRVSGVPPDYFSNTGQRWGNPLYKWGELRERGFDWWVARIRASLRSTTRFDSITSVASKRTGRFLPKRRPQSMACGSRRLDTNSSNGSREVFGNLPFIAEDLGLITPEVDELREHFGMPGMRILQFGFSTRGSHLYLPHRFVPNTVVYTGTHDNNTTLGWWREETSPLERKNVQTYLQPIRHEGQIVWAMIRAAARSVANLCIIPMQDVLHLGSECRMNTPAASAGNWTWRYRLRCAPSRLRG